MSIEVTTLLGRVSGGGDLSYAEMSAAIDAIMRGAWSEEQIALLLTGLAAKGETVDEVAGAAAAMRRHMTPIKSRHAELLDTCGTGGGGSNLFNISTTAAIVAAAAGVPVAKHGNRSITSKSGSADVLAELGVNVHATVAQVEACLNELGLCFCFAPRMHPAMKHVAAVRKRLGIRTIFNILGPLVNPAGACFQLLGAGRPELRPLLAGAMAKLGTRRTMVVSGEDGLGDVTLVGKTYVTEVIAAVGPPVSTPAGEPAVSSMREFVWSPEDFGIERSTLDSLVVDGSWASAKMIRAILAGERGPAHDIVRINAGAALWLVGRSGSPREAAQRAGEAIDDGSAQRLLGRLIAQSHKPV